jgi:hypothetical protein
MVKTAYETAQQKNGDHHGCYLQQLKLPDIEIECGIRSFRKQIAKHPQWINNPFFENSRFRQFTSRSQTKSNRTKMAARHSKTKRRDSNT